MELLLWAALVLAAIPAVLSAINLFVYRRLPRNWKRGASSVSLLIPARNEEATIAAALRSALASESVDLEVIVLDDGSTDETAAIVAAIAAEDGRVRIVQGSGLPEGWCGKQYACHTLGGQATRDTLCFIDADVRLEPYALARMAAWMDATQAHLISGFPRQLTGTFLERLLIPLIHFVLLGFLPVPFMRRFRNPGFAAGCGQLIMVRREAYRTCGGHSGIRRTLHDGLTLPKLFRSTGFRTDLFDATDVATCRMYRTAADVWHGLSKNATEGMAAPTRLPVFTTLLLGGQVLPWLLLPVGSPLAGLAVALGLATRLAGAIRFRQSLRSVLLHPVGVTVLLVLQWAALFRLISGQPSHWKGRAYVTRPTGP
ncbi:MAG TPA: glycosyltransferase family 2 protein [Bryobacteraceae bacterium]|nr:glycosyltransferase family 2 protein [Bryobacteraceae bacterium]